MRYWLGKMLCKTHTLADFAWESDARDAAAAAVEVGQTKIKDGLSMAVMHTALLPQRYSFGLGEFD
jgi:hypothetical protein